ASIFCSSSAILIFSCLDLEIGTPQTMSPHHVPQSRCVRTQRGGATLLNCLRFRVVTRTRYSAASSSKGFHRHLPPLMLWSFAALNRKSLTTDSGGITRAMKKNGQCKRRDSTSPVLVAESPSSWPVNS